MNSAHIQNQGDPHGKYPIQRRPPVQQHPRYCTPLLLYSHKVTLHVPLSLHRLDFFSQLCSRFRRLSSAIVVIFETTLFEIYEGGWQTHGVLLPEYENCAAAKVATGFSFLLYTLVAVAVLAFVGGGPALTYVLYITANLRLLRHTTVLIPGMSQ